MTPPADYPRTDSPIACVQYLTECTLASLVGLVTKSKFSKTEARRLTSIAAEGLYIASYFSVSADRRQQRCPRVYEILKGKGPVTKPEAVKLIQEWTENILRRKK